MEAKTPWTGVRTKIDGVPLIDALSSKGKANLLGFIVRRKLKKDKWKFRSKV